MLVAGYYYPPKQSRRCAAQLVVEQHELYLVINASAFLSAHPTLAQKQALSFCELTIAARIGNSSRCVSFADGGRFETTANDALDQLAALFNPEQNITSRITMYLQTLVYRLESSFSMLMLALVIITSSALLGYFKALPMVAHKLAHAVPQTWIKQSAQGILKQLDATFFKPSQVSTEKQQRLRKLFNKTLIQLGLDSAQYQLHFRRFNATANAFALPAGDIIVTDRLLEIMPNEQEIQTILLHEIGHIVERHGIEQTIRSSFLTVVAAYIIGDLSGMGEIVSGVPLFIVQSGYSRKHERSADDFALSQLNAAGNSAQCMASALARLYVEYEFSDDALNIEPCALNLSSLAQHQAAPWWALFSTHPQTMERIRTALNVNAQTCTR